MHSAYRLVIVFFPAFVPQTWNINDTAINKGWAMKTSKVLNKYI